MGKRLVTLAALVLVLCAGFTSTAQDIGGLFGLGRDAAGARVDGSEFVFARLEYSGGRWDTDWWEADAHFMVGMDRLTNIRVVLDDYIHVRPSDPAIYEYPLLYAVEVGYWYLTDEDAAALREYLDRGGFLVVDDFWGTRQWADFQGQLLKIFPDREVEEVPLSHPVFHSFYDIDEIIQVPNISNARRGGPTWEQDVIDPYALGIFDDDRRLMVMINYNTDLGDAWEWADDPTYPHFYSGFAYRMGINFILYAMTH